MKNPHPLYESFLNRFNEIFGSDYRHTESGAKFLDASWESLVFGFVVEFDHYRGFPFLRTLKDGEPQNDSLKLKSKIREQIDSGIATTDAADWWKK